MVSLSSRSLVRGHPTPSVPCTPMTARRLLRTLWLIGMLVAGSEPLAAPAGPALPAASAWLEVRERTACEAMRDEYCVGRYGFAVERGGKFVAGGFGGSRTIEGTLALPDLHKLDSLIREAYSSARSGVQVCRQGGLPGIRDQVDLTFTDGRAIRLYDLGGQVGKVCCVGSWDRVRRLHDHLRRLMNRHYPVPFPAHRG
jgi:hypothetical protein